MNCNSSRIDWVSTEVNRSEFSGMKGSGAHVSNAHVLPDPERSRLVFTPTPAAVAGALVAAIVFVVVLEFLVFISFLGQHMWDDPALFSDHWHTAPLYLWFAVVALAAAVVLRIVTYRVVIDARGVAVRGLLRRPRTFAWEDIAGIWTVRDIYRGKSPRDPVDDDLDAAEALLIMAKKKRRVANLSGRFFGANAQATLLSAAEDHGIRVERIDHARPGELNHMLPGSQKFVDRHPSLVAAAVLLLYLAHNVFTFMVWGL